MNYLKLAPLFVYLLTAAVSARPLDQAIPIGGNTLGLVLPEFVPNIKAPVPSAGGSAQPTGVPSVPGAPALPGLGSSKSPGTSGVSSVSGAAKPAKAVLPIRRSPGPGPSHANPRLQPRMVREPDYAAANTNSTIPVAPSHSDTPSKREVDVKKFRKGWVIPPPPSTTTSEQNHAKRAPKHSRKKGFGAHKRPTANAAQRPTHTANASPEHTAPAKPDLQAEHAAKDQEASDTSSSSSSPAKGLSSLVQTTKAGPILLGQVADGAPKVPDTPITTADTTPTIDAADKTADDTATKAKVPQPVVEKAPAVGDTKGAYPTYNAPLPSAPVTPPAAPAPVPAPAKRGLLPGIPTSKANQKGQDLVLDTDPIIPPSEAVKEEKDPKMGVVNVDSNYKGDPPKPLPSGQLANPKPSASAAAAKVPIPSESIYQPKEPGYGNSGGYDQIQSAPAPASTATPAPTAFTT